MKKKIREQINELAAQILSKENEHTTTFLKEATRSLYEQLILLEYLESPETTELLSSRKESFDSKGYREANWFKEPDPLPKPEIQDEIIEPAMEKIKDIVAQMPANTRQVDELLDELLPKQKNTMNELEEFAANYQKTPVFERKEPQNDYEDESRSGEQKNSINTSRRKPRSINDAQQKGLVIGLNDRIAFINHLFDGNTEDYSRVISQMGTFNTFEEVVSFINDKVRPDHNNWEGKEEFSDRFMTIIDKSFNA